MASSPCAAALEAARQWHRLVGSPFENDWIAIWLALRCAGLCAIAGVLGGVTAGAVTLLTAPQFLLAAYGSVLLLTSVLGGSITGHRVGGRMGALAGAMIMPLVTTLLLAVMSFLGAAPALVGHAVLSGERGATGSGQILASLLGCSAGIAGMLRVLRGILRQRLQRIRVWNATVRVVAGSITGVAVGTGLVLVLVAALPPDKWPRSYSLLVEAATLFISGGTAGLVDGAVAGWLVKEIGA